MAQLTIQKLTENEQLINFATSDDVGGDLVAWSPNLVIMMRNPTGGAITVTIPAQVTSANVASLGEVVKEDETIALAQDEVRAVGVLPRTSFANVDGNVSLTYSGPGVEVATFIC